MEKSTKRQCVQWLENTGFRDFPGGPVAGTQCFHCWGPGSIPSRELGSCKPQRVAITENICKRNKQKKPASFKHQRNCSKGGSVVKNLPVRAGDTRDKRWILAWEETLEEEMANHCSIHA